MARKSKYEKQSNKLSTALWKPALYIRLSREDGDREESNSIASQRELLTEFVDTQTDMADARNWLSLLHRGRTHHRTRARKHQPVDFAAMHIAQQRSAENCC